MTAAGWYQAEGDPVGTTRYWDGRQWIGEPVYTPAGYSAPGVPLGGMHNLASPGARIGARFIDLLIVTVIALVLFLPAIRDIVNGIDALGPSPTDTQVQRVITDAVEDNFSLFGAIGLGAVLWDFAWVAFFAGTPGKLMLGLRVARADDGTSPPGFGKAALRSLNRLVAMVPGYGSVIVMIAGIASLIMLFADSQHRTVMDRVASTVVVKK